MWWALVASLASPDSFPQSRLQAIVQVGQEGERMGTGRKSRDKRDGRNTKQVNVRSAQQGRPCSHIFSRVVFVYDFATLACLTPQSNPPPHTHTTPTHNTHNIPHTHAHTRLQEVSSSSFPALLAKYCGKHSFLVDENALFLSQPKVVEGAVTCGVGGVLRYGTGWGGTGWGGWRVGV